jgi:hypothetical protein
VYSRERDARGVTERSGECFASARAFAASLLLG